MSRGLGVVLATALVLASGDVALAFQCPTLIERAQAALADFKRTAPAGVIKDARVAAVESKLRYAQEAHAGEQHDIAVKEATEALKQLGR
jgi:hypothetical protein